jgi:hypothetical protein
VRDARAPRQGAPCADVSRWGVAPVSSDNPRTLVQYHWTLVSTPRIQTLYSIAHAHDVSLPETSCEHVRLLLRSKSVWL